MTAEDIVNGADKVRPNIVTHDTKLGWVDVIEKQVREHMTRFNETPAKNDTGVLSLGSEYKDMYIYYVVSMIDLSNLDIAMYNNSTAFFNEMFDAWQKKWRREHMPYPEGGAV